MTTPLRQICVAVAAIAVALPQARGDALAVRELPARSIPVPDTVSPEMQKHRSALAARLERDPCNGGRMATPSGNGCRSSNEQFAGGSGSPSRQVGAPHP